MNYTKELALCPFKKEDCFGLDGIYCTCLQDTKFKQTCPFYKPKKEYEKELEKYPFQDIEKERRRKKK